MNIELALVDQQVQGLVQKLNTKLDNNPDKQISKAFLLLSIKTLFDIEDDEEALDFIYDSGNDYSIDAIFVSDVITMHGFVADNKTDHVGGVGEFGMRGEIHR